MRLKRRKILFAGLLCLAFGIASLSACSKSANRETTTTEAASERKSSFEMLYLGNDAYKQGHYEEAVKWWRKAAEQGDVDAQRSLGTCYDNGFGVAKDFSEAAKWYRKAAEQGDADAQTSLGYFYYFGHGVAKDFSEAAKWYRKAAEQGHANAQCALGSCYYGGYGVAQDDSEARYWFQKAADNGDERAKEMLEKMDSRGL